MKQHVMATRFDTFCMPSPGHGICILELLLRLIDISSNGSNLFLVLIADLLFNYEILHLFICYAAVCLFYIIIIITIIILFLLMLYYFVLISRHSIVLIVVRTKISANIIFV
jgi:hypothetical protein